jgi:hypothetical protein
MTLFPCDPLVLSSSYLLLWLDYGFYHPSIACCSLSSHQLPVKLGAAVGTDTCILDSLYMKSPYMFMWGDH